MKTAIALILLGLLGGSLPPPLPAMDWPSEDGEIRANFGFNDQGRPVLGTVFQTENPALAADQGELIFYRRQEDSASRLPSPLGAWAVLDHGDGILGIYSRFQDGEAPIAAPEGTPPRIQRAGLIAPAGRSGWTNQRGFYFTLFDRRERRWVNPSLIIAPLPDDSPPRIQQIQLRNAAGQILPPSQTRISQGPYSIIVTATDTRSRSSPFRLAPHRLMVSLNGVEAGSLSFETYSARMGVLLLNRNGLTPVSSVYAPYPAFELGEAWFTRGQTSLELIVRDVQENESNARLRLEVE